MTIKVGQMLISRRLRLQERRRQNVIIVIMAKGIIVSVQINQEDAQDFHLKIETQEHVRTALIE